MSDQVASGGEPLGRGWVAPDPQGTGPQHPSQPPRPHDAYQPHQRPQHPPQPQHGRFRESTWDPYGRQRFGWDPAGMPVGLVVPGQARDTSGFRPPRAVERPRYREPLPIRPARLVLGCVGGLLWMALVGAQAVSFAGYGWATIIGGVLAWIVAVVLSRLGDRGVAAGIAGASAMGISVAVVMIIMRWADSGWPLW